MDEHGIDVHCLVPLPWLECEPKLHANETKALEVQPDIVQYRGNQTAVVATQIGNIFPTADPTSPTSLSSLLP